MGLVVVSDAGVCWRVQGVEVRAGWMHTPMGSERRSKIRQLVCRGELNMAVTSMNQAPRDLELVEVEGMGEGVLARMEIEALLHVVMSEPKSMQGAKNISKHYMDDWFFDCHAYGTRSPSILGINAQLVFYSRHRNGIQ